MSTSNHNLAENEGAKLTGGQLAAFRCAVVTADWNSHITHRLRDGALQTLAESGVPAGNVDSFAVPGAVELVYAAARCLKMKKYDAVLVFGCVIRGDTPHFDYVCQIASQGTAQLNALGETPVIFGVLTVDNEQQALDRAGGMLGNKGSEAAETALRLAAAFAEC